MPLVAMPVANTGLMVKKVPPTAVTPWNTPALRIRVSVSKPGTVPSTKILSEPTPLLKLAWNVAVPTPMILILFPSFSRKSPTFTPAV